MTRFIYALVVCFLLGTFSNPTPTSTAAPVGDKQTPVVITQEPVDGPDVAKLVVEGPTKVKAGDLVVISVEKSRAASFKWIVLPSTNNFLVIDEGKRIVFSSGVGGDFKFIVACSLGDTCDVAVHTVTVIGEAAGPTNNLSSRIALWCEDVQSDSKRDDCLKLAQSFSSVASVMEGKSLTTPSEFVSATYKSNQDALGDKIEDWTPFRENMADYLTQLAEDGKLETTQDHVKVWRAIAEGLREYADTL